MPRRWSEEWFAYVAETGRWDLPRIHRTRGFLAQSPWPADVVNAAIGRARAVLTPDVGKRVFGAPHDSPTLYSLFVTLSPTANNPLLRFALDLLHAGKLRPRLRHRLTIEDLHWGARFELAVLAAARRAGIRCRFEPLGDRGPDLLVGLEQVVFVELKAAKTSAVWRQREQTWQTIIIGGCDGKGMIDLAPIDLTFTDQFKELDATHEGRCHLERIADRLGRSVAAAARVMASNSVVVDDLVRLTIAPDGRPGEHAPLVPRYEDEVSRILDGPVLDACEQLPRGGPGLIIIETERSWAPLDDLRRQTAAWFEGPIGSEYPHVAGVLYTYRPWWASFPGVQLVPVWRHDAPRWLVRSRGLRELALGLGWADLCAWASRRNHALPVTVS